MPAEKLVGHWRIELNLRHLRQTFFELLALRVDAVGDALAADLARAGERLYRVAEPTLGTESSPQR
jgi:hypothetical protein